MSTNRRTARFGRPRVVGVLLTLTCLVAVGSTTPAVASGGSVGLTAASDGGRAAIGLGSLAAARERPGGGVASGATAKRRLPNGLIENRRLNPRRHRHWWQPFPVAP